MMKKNVKSGEDAKILIGRDIYVEILRTAGNRVTILIDAPKHIPIVTVDRDRDSKAIES